MKRAALYIDGFNLYHAINDLGEPFLKWCDLWRLGEIILPSTTEKLVKAVYCSAFYPGDDKKKWRHKEYIAALKVKGVEVVLGHYIHEPQECRDCGRQWEKPTEKESDVNVALHLIRDGMHDRFDVAYLITADSDQAATVRMFKAEFPSKEFVTVAPPERNFSTSIDTLSHRRIALNRDHLDRCVMPEIVMGNNKRAARRPREYAPPAEWVHPDHRPR